MKKVAFYTLGCKVNQYETEAMLELFEKEGYEKAETEDYADVYVINTCTVTHMSDRKSRQYIRRMKIVEEVKKIDASRKVSTVDDIMKVKAFEEIEINKTNGKTRAFMKIQDGCDRYCSYCIIPYARGRVRSRDLESIVKEVENLASNGYKEVVLTGIHVASYGKDIKDSDIKLLDVIKQINDIEGIERIRLSSVEPILFTDEFVEAVSTMDKVCPHYHLSLQSGCDETLKRMKRRYTTEEYKAIVDRLRAAIPNVSITTDVIVGFPGETNEEFDKTYEFLKDIELTHMHVFKYSPRKGTPAATMENQVDPSTKHDRSEKLLQLNEENFNKFGQKMLDKEFNVLFEQKVGDNKYEGLTENYVKVIVESDNDISEQILKVKIKDVKNEFLEGILV